MVWWTAAVSIGLGVALGIYTGILLSALGARPFWNSAILGPLFLVSGLSSAAAFTHLVARDREESRMFAMTDNVFLAVELLRDRAVPDRPAVSRRRRTSRRPAWSSDGPFTAVFWVLVVGARDRACRWSSSRSR